MTAWNLGEDEVRLGTPNKHLFEIAIVDREGSEVIWHYPSVSFPACNSITFESGEAKTFVFDWGQNDHEGNRLEEGHYLAQGIIPAWRYTVLDVHGEIERDGNPSEEVLPPSDFRSRFVPLTITGN